MPQVNVGSGIVSLAPPASATDQSPIHIATLQEVSLDYSETIIELMGDSGFAIEAAVTERKLTGKAKFGKVSTAISAAAMDGSVVTTGSKIYKPEAILVATHAATVSGSATFDTDLGVYAADGTPYKKVAASPTGLQYSVAAGVYSFETATQDGKLLTFRYLMTQAGGFTTTLSNLKMGIATKYKIALFNQPSANLNNTFGADLACVVIPKLAFPFKNTAFTIPEIDFQCLDDGSGNVIKLYGAV